MTQENRHMKNTLARRVRVPLLAAAGAALLVVGMTGTAYATGNHGGGHTPVTICHNGHTITVDGSAVKAHIKHGDTLGPCPVVTPEPTPEPTTPPTGEPTPEPTVEPTPPVTPEPEPTPTTPAPEPTEPPVTETPAPEPTTPPTETPAPVVVPQIQDYITCKGGAFVLDNTGSTVPVTYTINDLPFTVEAGQAVHTDADGTLIQPNSDYAGYTIKAGERTWNFPSAGNCPTVPTTPEPTAPVETPAPSDEPTPPVVVPSDQPTAPNPTGATPAPAPEPTSPSGITSDRSTTHASNVTPDRTRTAAQAEDGTTRTSLAYTGSDPLLFGTGIAAVLVVGLSALFLVVLSIRRNRRTRDEL